MNSVLKKIEKDTMKAFEKQTRKNLRYESVTFGHGDLESKKFENYTFKNVRFPQTGVKNIILRNCTFENCIISGGFINSEIESCVFNNCDFAKAQFLGVKMMICSFKCGDFTEAYFNENTRISSATYFERCNFSFISVEGHPFLPGNRYQLLDMRGADIKDEEQREMFVGASDNGDVLI